MENLITYPVNNVLFDAEDAELFHCTRTSGVFMGDDFSATAGGSDATVTVSEGLAWIRDAKFKGKAAALKSTATLSFTVSDATYPRYDAITLRYDIAGGKTTLLSRSGTASSNPVKPSPVRNASVYELMLYHVYRPAGSSVITQDNIIDLRNNSEYCGYMVDDVSAFDKGKFLSKESYDPSDSVANAGGIAAYVSQNSTKVIVENSVSSGSTTNAASADAVRRAYNLASNAIPSSKYNVANGVAPLNENAKVPFENLPIFKSGSIIIMDGLLPMAIRAKQYLLNVDEDDNIFPEITGIYNAILANLRNKIFDIRLVLSSSSDADGVPNIYYFSGDGTYNGKQYFSFFSIAGTGTVNRIRIFENNSVEFAE